MNPTKELLLIQRKFVKILLSMILPPPCKHMWCVARFGTICTILKT